MINMKGNIKPKSCSTAAFDHERRCELVCSYAICDSFRTLAIRTLINLC